MNHRDQNRFSFSRQQLICLVGGIIVALVCLLLFLGRKPIVTSAKALFDTRQNLTEITLFETLANAEITSIHASVQSLEYPDYTEEKEITDPAEIAAFVAAISAAKLEEDEPFSAEVSTDYYTFTLADETITVYTQANDACFLQIENSWQAIDWTNGDSLFTLFDASSSATTIRDTNGLIFYPQVWQAGESETSDPSYGIDVSYYQGVIDWAQVAEDGVDFAMIRIGVRYAQSGILEEDALARYNLQEATKYGIAVGAYFFSTAITEEEVLEEAQLAIDLLSGYAITYPVVYDCEGYSNADNRHSSLSISARSALAELFLQTIEDAGYTGMFYASKSALEANTDWETNTLQSKYRIWVAQYPGDENEVVPQGSSSYSGRHEMWQYTCEASVAGIVDAVDRNIAYFSYDDSTVAPMGDVASTVAPDYDALAKMEEVGDLVTAKEFVNVRSSMSSADDSNLLGTLTNGEVVTRIAVGANGWSKIAFNGGEGYVMTSLVTTDLTTTTTQGEDDFTTVFETVNEQVTAKEITNLRSMPSVTNEESEVVAVLTNGEVVTRTGVSSEGFSRVEYHGQTLYCVSSYLEVVG